MDFDGRLWRTWTKLILLLQKLTYVTERVVAVISVPEENECLCNKYYVNRLYGLFRRGLSPILSLMPIPQG